MNDAQFNEVLKRFDALAEKLGPEITETVLAAAQAAAYRDMVESCLWTLTAIIPFALSVVGLWFLRRCWIDRHESPVSAEGVPMFAAFSVLLFGVGAFITAASLFSAFNPLAVQGRVNPKVYVAQKVLKF